MKFNDKIIKIRKENGLSQEEFGNKINVSRQAISKWESEQSQPEVDKIKEISKVYGVSIEYLLNDEIENENYNVKKEGKFNKKKLLKTLLNISIIIIVLYLLYGIYKFIILFNRYNNIQKISDNEIYRGTISSYYEDKMTKNMSKFKANIFRGKDLYISNVYSEFSSNYAQEYNLINQDIIYINKEKGLAFNLIYDKEKQKYIYNKEFLNEMNESDGIIGPYDVSRKDIYMQGFLESNTLSNTPIFIQILKASIDPTIFVTNGYMKYFYSDGFKVVKFNDVGDIYEGISSVYLLTDEEENTSRLDFNLVHDYNFSYYNEDGEIIECNLLNDIKSVEDFAEICDIEVIIEE